MRNLCKTLLRAAALAALLAPLAAQAALNVFACEPEWAALTSRRGRRVGR